VAISMPRCSPPSPSWLPPRWLMPR
jgi:hypothetical protein